MRGDHRLLQPSCRPRPVNCDKVSFVEAEALRVQRPKDDCYKLHWMEIRLLTHKRTHTVFCHGEHAQIPGALSCMHPGTNPAFITAGKLGAHKQQQHTPPPPACVDDNSYERPLGSLHWGKKCSSEFRSLASCGGNDLNSQFQIRVCFFQVAWLIWMITPMHAKYRLDNYWEMGTLERDRSQKTQEWQN